MTTELTGLRREQVAEALGDLEHVFLEPGCFGDCSVADAAESLASEFVGAYRDDEVVRRLGELATAESSGDMRRAGRHLRAVRRKLAERWGVTAAESEPLIADADARRMAVSMVPDAAKPLVAESHARPVSPQPPRHVPAGPNGPRARNRRTAAPRAKEAI